MVIRVLRPKFRIFICPYDKKKKIIGSIIEKCLDLTTDKFNTLLSSNASILLQKLLKAIKEGKISKVMARIIVRRLRKKGIPMASNSILYF